MSFEMEPQIKTVLEKIEFVNRYKLLSDRFRGNPNDVNDRLENYNLGKVNETFAKLGYDAAFNSKEKFFKVGVVIDSTNYTIWCNVILEYGMTEFIWVVYYNNELRLGSPWSVYSRLLIDPNERIKKPVYRSYEELEEILKEAFLMYEDFKFNLINL